MKARDLTGYRSGKLTAKRYIGSVNQRRRWLCKCDCGSSKELTASDLTSGKVVSCGCHKNALTSKRNKDNTKHGLTGSPTWISWFQMRQRCNNPNATDFKYWGGRGVKVDPSWDDFRSFLNDMGERPEGKTLDRINPFSDYQPGNCRWATPKEQSNNTRKKYLDQHNL